MNGDEIPMSVLTKLNALSAEQVNSGCLSARASNHAISVDVWQCNATTRWVMCKIKGMVRIY